MIVRMTRRARPQQRYDHRLRDLVRQTGDVTLATDLGVPRSTARGWLHTGPTVVVSLDGTHRSELDLYQEIRQLRRRIQKLTALLRLVLTLLRASRFTLSRERLPDGHDKRRILDAVVGRGRTSRCGRCYGSWTCRRVGSTPGDDGRPRVRSTTSHPVRAPRRIGSRSSKSGSSRPW
jgi:hypothetical protein